MEPLAQNRITEWDEFVRISENGTIFHTQWWHDAWGCEYGICAHRNDAGEITAGSIFNVTQRYGVIAIAPPPLSPQNGPVFRSPLLENLAERYSFFKWLQFSYIAACPTAGYCEVRLGSHMPDALAFSWVGFETSEYSTYIITPDSDWRQRMSYEHARRLNAARHEAGQLDCSLTSGESLNDVLPVLRLSAQANAFQLTEPLEHWWEQVKLRGAGTIYLLRDGRGRALCGTVVVWDRRRTYYLLGGIHPEVRARWNLNFLLIQRMIEDTQEAGRIFDFEGSGLQGVERFFRGWGGEVDQGHLALRISQPKIAELFAQKRLRELESRYRLDVRVVAAASGVKL